MLNPARLPQRDAPRGRTALAAGAPAGTALWLGLALLALSSDVAAAPLSVVATSVGPLFALGALVLAKAHAAGSLKAAGGAVALSAVALLMWRSMRGQPAALPWRGGRPAKPRPGAMPGVLTVPACTLPAELDCAALSRALGEHFVRLQAAWDAGDCAALGRLTTPDMLDDLRQQLAERGVQHNRTEVVALHTRLLSFERCEGAELACVEFSGSVRESDERGVVPFTEIWMLVRSHDADPWRLARQQALF